MNFDFQFDCSGVNWQTVADTLKRAGMGYHAPEIHQKAFEASYATVFAYHDGQLIGFGRAISDGAYQTAIYDVAIAPEFQRKGLGTMILKHILDRVGHCNVILYASPGKEAFYQKLGLRRMKTGMALFQNGERMQQKGFTE